MSYDPQADILYLSEEGVAPETVEIIPCVNLELNPDGVLIGVEIFRAAENLLGEAIIEPLLNGGEFCKVALNGSLADLDAQLRPAEGSPHKDYLEDWPDHVVVGEEAEKILETVRYGIAALLEQVKDGTGVTVGNRRGGFETRPLHRNGGITPTLTLPRQGGGDKPIPPPSFDRLRMSGVRLPLTVGAVPESPLHRSGGITPTLTLPRQGGGDKPIPPPSFDRLRMSGVRLPLYRRGGSRTAPTLNGGIAPTPQRGNHPHPNPPPSRGRGFPSLLLPPCPSTGSG